MVTKPSIGWSALPSHKSLAKALPGHKTLANGSDEPQGASDVGATGSCVSGACAPQVCGLALVYSLGLCVWHFVPQACGSHVRWCTALTINIIYASQPLATCESLRRKLVRRVRVRVRALVGNVVASHVVLFVFECVYYCCYCCYYCCCN